MQQNKIPKACFHSKQIQSQLFSNTLKCWFAEIKTWRMLGLGGPAHDSSESLINTRWKSSRLRLTDKTATVLSVCLRRWAGISLHGRSPWKRGGRSGDASASHAVPVQRVQGPKPQSPAAGGGDTHPPGALAQPRWTWRSFWSGQWKECVCF